MAQPASWETAIAGILRHQLPSDPDLVPSLLIGIWKADTAYVLTYGEPADTAGFVELGSLTKPVVAWLAASHPALAGRSADDIPVCALWPDSACEGEWRSVTPGDLLNHRAGLPRWPPGIGEGAPDSGDPYRHFDAEALYRAIQSVQPRPGVFRYSHLGYAALTPFLRSAGGLDTLVARANRAFGLAFDLRDDARLLPGRTLGGQSAQPWHTDALAPALGLRAGIHTLIRWMRQIAPEISAEMTGMSLTRRSYRRDLRAGRHPVCRGWFLIPVGRHMAAYHNGRTGGHFATMAFAPSARTGVVVLGTGAAGPGQLSVRILEEVLR